MTESTAWEAGGAHRCLTVAEDSAVVFPFARQRQRKVMEILPKQSDDDQGIPRGGRINGVSV